ncbi:MAG: HAMP domain-containing histidine kinase [Acidimicrobiales bacterium]|nr:HAMP domain-containing histidine kinase [Acidimicrobiales bacterium]
MTRRITVAIVAVVVLSLLLVGFGTLVLTRRQDRETTETELRRQAEVIATFVEALPAVTALDNPLRVRLERVRAALQLNDVTVLVVRGGVVVDGDLPNGVSDADLDLTELRTSGQVGGAHGSLVYAAALAELPGNLQAVVVLTSTSDPVVGPVVRWFLLAAAITLVAAVVVALVVGRRLGRPLREAGTVAHRIAAGDLSARVQDHPDDDELGELTTALNTMAASLERSRGLERQFLLSVSHDLRTPLTSIRGYAEAITDGTTDDPRSAAGVILGESRRLERLVADLLDLARLEARRFGFDTRTVDLGDIVLDVAAGFERELARHDIELVTGGPGSAVPVHVDPDRTAQVLANLLENATKFATSRIEVTWATSTPAGAAPGALPGASVSVVDDGQGIAEEDRPHVFERLYVARRQPRRKESGSGLGLAIVKELTEGMGGRVSVAPTLAGGTRFDVWLPGPAVSAGEGSGSLPDGVLSPPPQPPMPPTGRPPA